MASYCQEKFTQDGTMTELKVCWRQDKHVHDATLITTIAIWLGTTQGGTWTVRANSYESNKQSCSVGAVTYP
ncbi:hypothetical protein IB241_23420 [Pseudomonas sp. PDM05]|jgi:hypothetical protein|nr:hypothetical protein [Pseudomonas sp. PDM05]